MNYNVLTLPINAISRLLVQNTRELAGLVNMQFENWVKRILITLGAVKCALVMAFFASFGLVQHNVAFAESAVVCEGVDLLEKLKSENPDVYAEVLKEAAEVKNSNANFWKIEKNGYPASYLFGTMHMADPKIATLKPEVETAVAASERLVIESVDALNPAAAQAAMAKLGHLTLLTDGTLRELVKDDLEEKLEASLLQRGLPMQVADRLQPWLITTMISLPICEIQSKQSGAKVLDAVLVEFAKEKGKDVEGLETVEEQLSAMASLPQDYHVSALEETLANDGLANNMIETLKVLYLEDEMGIVLPLMKRMSPESYSGQGAAQFQKALIEKRNVVMAERVLPLLKSGKNFVAVGALHLQGDTGLVNLLQQEGFDVTPIQ